MRKFLHLVVACSIFVAGLVWSSRADAALSVYHVYIVWVQGEGEGNQQNVDAFLECLLNHSTYVDYWNGGALVVEEGSYVVPKPSGALSSTSAVGSFVTQLINNKAIPTPPSYGTPVFVVMTDPSQTSSGLVNGVGGLNDKGTVLGKPAGLILITTNPKASSFWSLRTALADETVATQHEVAEAIDTLRGGQGCSGDFCCQGWCNNAPSCSNMDGLQCPGAPAKTFTGSSSCGSVNGWLVQTLTHQGAKTCSGTATCDFALATSCAGDKANLHASCTADTDCCASTVCRKWAFSNQPDDPPSNVCCNGVGTTCTAGTDCCGGMVCDATSHTCVCVAAGDACANDDDCCSGLTCQTGLCALAPPPLVDAGSDATTNSDAAPDGGPLDVDGGPGIPIDQAGCSCGVATSTTGGGGSLAAVAIAGLLTLRRRRTKTGNLPVMCVLLALPACGASTPNDAPDASPTIDAGYVDHAADATPDVGAIDDAALDVFVAPDAGLPPGMLDTSIVSQIVEPEGYGKDDASHSFTDKNYWNFCMPGAATVALYYFLPANITSWPAGDFREPSNAPSSIPAAGTYWKSDEAVNGYHTYGRAYLMHLAEQVKPPSYVAAGMANFAAYPSTGATLVDVRDAMNWEASGHAASYASFFYSIVSWKGLTAAALYGDVKKTIDGGHAVVAAVDTGYLPNWSRSLSHAITVVGYDDAAVTYKYTDTCGIHCNGSAKSKNGGVWTIGQTALFNAIESDGAGYVK